jgi:hypothetical protein
VAVLHVEGLTVGGIVVVVMVAVVPGSRAALQVYLPETASGL